VGVARAPWQFAGLSAGARELYDAIEQQGMLLVAGRNAKQLEQRLLVHGQQVHTDAGHHELRLERWELWADRAGIAGTLTPQAGQLQIETAMQAIGWTASRLPWAR
jgi:hypothetical protein